jgi:hypothetical protein
MTNTLTAPGARCLLLVLSLAGCTNFPDPTNRAAADGVMVAAAGTLIGGLVAGGVGLSVGFPVGAVIGAIGGAITPPSPEFASPAFPF